MKSTLRECMHVFKVCPVLDCPLSILSRQISVRGLIPPRRRRQKKRIRRIFDDVELAEETKSSMAQEKAKQEHLKSMQESANKWTSMIPSTSPPASVDVNRWGPLGSINMVE